MPEAGATATTKHIRKSAFDPKESQGSGTLLALQKNRPQTQGGKVGAGEAIAAAANF